MNKRIMLCMLVRAVKEQEKIKIQYKERSKDREEE